VLDRLARAPLIRPSRERAGSPPRVLRPRESDGGRKHLAGRVGHDMIHRIVPNLKVSDARAGHDFYVDFLGLTKQFDLGWVASFCSPDNRAIQVSLVSGDASAPEDSAITVAVDDVEAAYAEARRRGYEIVHPLTEEAWGPRRFFVRDPNGVVVNVLGHAD
jgi:uncharacterized glyoxalase superfamily protein PhnB